MDKQETDPTPWVISAVLLFMLIVTINGQKRTEKALDTLAWYQENAVLITKTSTEYHIYGCKYIENSKVTLVNISSLNENYTPCYCYGETLYGDYPEEEAYE